MCGFIRVAPRASTSTAKAVSTEVQWKVAVLTGVQSRTVSEPWQHLQGPRMPGPSRPQHVRALDDKTPLGPTILPVK